MCVKESQNNLNQFSHLKEKQMSKHNLLKRIASVATELDMKGFTKEAKHLDAMLLKLASENMEFDDSVPPFDKEFLNDNKPLQDARDLIESIPFQLYRYLSNRVHNVRIDLDGIIKHIEQVKNEGMDEMIQDEVEWLENEFLKYREATWKFTEFYNDNFPHLDF
jgi:hypothetical protein